MPFHSPRSLSSRACRRILFTSYNHDIHSNNRSHIRVVNACDAVCEFLSTSSSMKIKGWDTNRILSSPRGHTRAREITCTWQGQPGRPRGRRIECTCVGGSSEWRCADGWARRPSLQGDDRQNYWSSPRSIDEFINLLQRVSVLVWGRKCVHQGPCNSAGCGCGNMLRELRCFEVGTGKTVLVQSMGLGKAIGAGGVRPLGSFMGWVSAQESAWLLFRNRIKKI